MNLQSLSGIFLISGFVLYFLAMIVAPRLYQEDDLEKRVDIIESKKTRWILSQVMFALGMVLPGVGFVALALSSPSTWPLTLGVAAFFIGGLLGAVLLYRQTVDPLGFWKRSAAEPLSNGYFFLTVIGFLLVGIALMQGGLPAWLAYLNMGAAIISTAVYLVRRGSGAFFLTLLFYLVVLVDGIMVLLADR